MKMAKASEQDIDVAMALVHAVESLASGFMPTANDDEDAVWFDERDGEDCKKALWILLDIARKGSLGRVVCGMAVLLDPDNHIVDPNLDYLDHHPNRDKLIELAAIQATILRDTPCGVDRVTEYWQHLPAALQAEIQQKQESLNDAGQHPGLNERSTQPSDADQPA